MYKPLPLRPRRSLVQLSTPVYHAPVWMSSGQFGAACAVGLSPVQAYVRIVLPQAGVAALPNICNLTVNLIKGTSLAFLMTVKDITAIAKVEASYGYNYIESYIDFFIIYIIICALTQYLFRLLERRAGRYKPTQSGREKGEIRCSKFETFINRFTVTRS